MGKSFGGNGGMGGGANGGGGMLRTVHRAVRAGVGGAAQESFSHSTTKTVSNTPTTRRTYKPGTSNTLSLSSSTTWPPFSTFNRPLSATTTWASSSSPTCSDELELELEWECVYGSEDETASGFYNDFVFESVPSKGEVQHAVSALQQVLNPVYFSQFIKDKPHYSSGNDVAKQSISPTGSVHRVPSAESMLDWIEPSLHLCNSRMLQPHGSDRVYDAFHLLQTEPSVQKMVASLSSDKAVWEAVLNNDVVREIKESLNAAESCVSKITDEGSDGSNASSINILSWIFINGKAKLMELIEKITKMMNGLVESPDGEKTTDPFEEKLRASFLLSVVVFLIVVVSRAHRV